MPWWHEESGGWFPGRSTAVPAGSWSAFASRQDRAESSRRRYRWRVQNFAPFSPKNRQTAARSAIGCSASLEDALLQMLYSQ
jgi:hypothetical protein